MAALIINQGAQWRAANDWPQRSRHRRISWPRTNRPRSQGLVGLPTRRSVCGACVQIFDSCQTNVAH